MLLKQQNILSGNNSGNITNILSESIKPIVIIIKIKINQANTGKRLSEYWFILDPPISPGSFLNQTPDSYCSCYCNWGLFFLLLKIKQLLNIIIILTSSI